MRPILHFCTVSPWSKEKFGNFLRKSTVFKGLPERIIEAILNLGACGCVRLGSWGKTRHSRGSRTGDSASNISANGNQPWVGQRGRMVITVAPSSRIFLNTLPITVRLGYWGNLVWGRFPPVCLWPKKGLDEEENLDRVENGLLGPPLDCWPDFVLSNLYGRKDGLPSLLVLCNSSHFLTTSKGKSSFFPTSQSHLHSSDKAVSLTWNRITSFLNWLM